MQNQDEVIRTAAEDIRAYGAVAIVGAGASFPMGLPIIRQLPNLLWDALRGDTALLDGLKKQHGWTGSSGKEIIGNDKGRVEIAFRAIAQSPVARKAFQYEFAELNKHHIRRKSPVHTALVELLHRNYVETIISLNWDTLLEVAYEDRYGRSLQPGDPPLYKPHGDAADPDGRWILPFEDDENLRMVEQITSRLEELSTASPRVLLVIGYSEQDPVILDQIIKPLVEKWRVVRIGPTPRKGDEVRITVPAEESLPRLVAEMRLEEEVPGWEYVNFDNQHDLKYVLSGQPLGPADVKASPELDEVARVVETLKISNLAPISGPSGSGKSITAYQATHRLHLESYEILRLTEGERARAQVLERVDIENHVKALSGLRFPSVLLIDDAQNIDRQLLRRLRESTSSKLKLIPVYNDDEYVSGNTIYMDGRAAVRTIARALREQREETVAAVSALDSSVGDTHAHISIEHRIEEALMECENSGSEYPWHFVAVLTGIERQARNKIAYLRNRKRADLLLASIAVGQIVTRDSGASMEWLEKATKCLNKDNTWLKQSLQELRKIRLVLGDERLRCTHLRFAGTALIAICKDKDSLNTYKEPMVAMLQAAILDPTASLQGITWLLNELRHAGGSGPDGYGPVIDENTWRNLTARCWSASTGESRREASLLLGTLLHWHPGHLQAIRDHVDLLGHWLEIGDTNGTFGVSWLLDDLNQRKHDFPDAPEVAEQICSCSDPISIAASFSNATWSEAYLWGLSLRHIATACSDEWKQKLGDAIDRDALVKMVAGATPSTLYYLNEVIGGVLRLNAPLCEDIVYEVTPIFAGALNQDPLGAFEQIRMNELEIGYWRCSSSARRGEVGKDVEAVRILENTLDVNALAQAISNSKTRREWETCWGLLSFLDIVLPRTAATIVRKIDVDLLDKATVGLWSEMPDEITYLLCAITEARGRRIAEAWLGKHVNEIRQVNVRLLETMPQAVVKLVAAGATFGPANNPWIPVVVIVPLLASVAPDVAKQVAEYHLRAVGYTLTTVPLKMESARDFVRFLTTVEQLSPGIVNRALNTAGQIDSIEHQWRSVLRDGNPQAKKALKAVLIAAADSQSPLSEIAKRLLAKSGKRHSK